MTVREHSESLKELSVSESVFPVSEGRILSFRKERKVYPTAPLLYPLFPSWLNISESGAKP